MKKIISILAILVLIFSLSACKKSPVADDEEVILDKETEVPESEEPETEEPEQQEDDKTDEPEVQQPTVDNTADNEIDNTTEEPADTDEEPHDPALDRVFSPYEVIVVLTEEVT